MKLFLVESPAKIKTISKFLGKDFQIRASLGHIREIPKRGLGIDIKSGFQPSFQLIETKQNNTREVLELMQKAEVVYLAQDLDREGELIAWHLLDASEVSPSKVSRVIFHEITKTAVQNALENPRPLNQSLVDAGMARTILDRLIGYKLSPLIWGRFESSVPLSIGRVQTVALRVIVDRDREIDAFVKEEFWNIRADFPEGFCAHIVLPKDTRLDETKAQELIHRLTNPRARITDLESKVERRFPKAPFTTATLQQEASTKLKLSAKDTMTIAQQLYEGVSVNGEQKALITYMRTDAINLSQEALQAARQKILEQYGKDYLPSKPVEYKGKAKNAQEAHEAIRPVYFDLDPEKIRPWLKPKQFQLYQLIWNKTIACQMKPASFDATIVDIDINSIPFRAKGSILKFDGFLKAYDDRDLEDKKKDSDKDVELPPLQMGQELNSPKIVGEKKFTKPPSRYTEASLVKFLEKNGIGRPSTYATIIETLIKRQYVLLDKQNKFSSTTLGKEVSDWVKEHFPTVVDVEFTARVEDSLDEVAQGNLPWMDSVTGFYDPIKERIGSLQGFVEEDLQENDKNCPKCSSDLHIRSGKFGPFLGCSQYPACDYIRPKNHKQSPSGNVLPNRRVSTGIYCEKCGSEFVLRRSEYGKYFGCSNYPACSNKRNRLNQEELAVFLNHLKEKKYTKEEDYGKTEN